MAHFDLMQVLSATGGQLLVSGRSTFTGISTDTRTLQPGDLYIALRGERVNGHDYLAQAREKGAAGALIQDRVPGVHRRSTTTGDWSIIEVTDTLYALGQLACLHRRRFNIPIIGITGSAGKTTTKEMTAAILAQSRTVLKSPGNFNNEIGLPLTLFRLNKEHQAAVLEFGMRGRGQIGYLASTALPTVGVVTNIGQSHLELLGSQEEIALAKAELLDEMSSRSTAILPKLDPFFPLLRAHALGPVITVGDDADCDIWVSAVLLGEDGCARFTLQTPGESIPVSLAAPGRHQVWNALAAAAATLAVGVTLDEIQRGLAEYVPETGRMRMLQAPRGFFVVDDTYNANPTAMRATLDFLAETPGQRKVAVLGDMRELGPTEHEIHRALGAYAMAQHIDTLLATGDLGRDYVTGAQDSRAQWYPDHAALTAAALALLAPGDVVLVKGSRAMQMEEVVAALLAAPC
ncbi:MAG TPA: UDP-N-acetylmuramoyl-tripeptide--D-alanyl-D-alanine ligase [Armatimonadota bacterium]|jgi:UDP-N-acetylmuramoyl-tripeptide--D-alanyl-D-alanine ligase